MSRKFSWLQTIVERFRFASGQNRLRRGPPARTSVFEGLERRNLLEVTPSAAYSCSGANALSLASDSDADSITIATAVVDSVRVVQWNGNTVLCQEDASTVPAINVRSISISGGGGADTINLSAVDGTYFHSSLSDSITLAGGDGNDTITGSGYDDSIVGNDGNDSLTAGAGDDSIATGLGSDRIVYSGNSLGTDTIEASFGFDDSDIIDFSGLGGAATFDAAFTANPQLVYPSNLYVKLNGSSIIKDIVGTTYDDQLTGNHLANSITGGNGNDYFIGGNGNDTLVGGTGDDTYAFPRSDTVTNLGTDLLSENSNEGSDTLDFSQFGDGVELTLAPPYHSWSQTIESGELTITTNLPSVFDNVIGSNVADNILGHGGANVLEGLGGNDTVVGRDGNDTYVFRGSSNLGSDDHQGGYYPDYGTDTLDFSGLETTASIDLSQGSTQTVSSILSIALGSYGFGGVLVENVLGTANNDTITGNSLANTLTGNGGNDTLKGAAGNDTLDGGAGDDTYTFARAAASDNLGTDTLSDSDGADHLDFTSFIDGVELDLDVTTSQSIEASELSLVLNSGSIFERVTGGAAADSISGGASVDNVLTGLGGGDTLIGRGGNDTLDPGAGSDSLDGGDGNDTFKFTGSGTLGDDTIAGDSAPNTIDFSGLGGGVEFSLLSTSQQTPHAGWTWTITLGGFGFIRTAIGSAYADEIIGTDSADLIYGGAGDDTIEGNESQDTIYGEAGDDSLNGNIGHDLLVGGDDDDTLTGDGGDYAGEDTLEGGRVTIALSGRTAATRTYSPGRWTLATI